MDATVQRVREFNRAWTEVLGLLDPRVLSSDHSLAEARVLFELKRGDEVEQSWLRERLAMDPSFLSRVTSRLERQGLLESRPSAADRRARTLSLTRAGRRAALELDERSSRQIEDLLQELGARQRADVIESLARVRHLVLPRRATPEIELGSPGPGDLGWVVSRHGALYASEYGWNRDFEGLAASLVADFQEKLDPQRERAWIARVDGARAGCVFCRQRDSETAQLRMLLVEPWARGLGLGSRLVNDCLAFARSAGYGRIVLWTNDVLISARRIYESVGFALTEEERHHSFGHDLVGQTWELDLK